MSVRLKGVLMNHLHSMFEQNLFSNAIKLQDVACEMTFQTAQGYMEFENEKHSYLPVFHLIGSITEIRGDFPLHISSLYFGDEDRPYLTKDILYYPNPQEIAHMITVGQFYTKRFRVPAILDTQVYTFPARVNLTIIPSPNPAMYERATYGGDFVAETDMEKLNLPIVYVDFAGTGVTRKTDKLLDYYDIDFEEDFEIYPLTAESSGYVNPPLMMYMDAPEAVMEHDGVPENMAEMYITREEEMQMIRDQREREQQQQQQQEIIQEPQFQSEQQMSHEDLLIAKAARSIEQRVANRVCENEMETENVQETVEETVEQIEHDVMLDFLEQTNATSVIMFDESMHMMSEESEVGNNEMHESPDVPEQHVAVEVSVEQTEAMKRQDSVADMIGADDDFIRADSDEVDLAAQEGADVQDASLQTKLDEAHTKDIAKNVAVNIQDEIVEQDELAEQIVESDTYGAVVHSDIVEQRVLKSKDGVGNRDVPSNMREITEEYDMSKSDTGEEFQ